MSILKDALKKVQTSRSDGPHHTAPSPARASEDIPPMPRRRWTPLLLMGGSALLAVGALGFAAATYLARHPGGEPVAAAASLRPVPATAPALRAPLPPVPTPILSIQTPPGTQHTAQTTAAAMTLPEPPPMVPGRDPQPAQVARRAPVETSRTEEAPASGPAPVAAAAPAPSIAPPAPAAPAGSAYAINQFVQSLELSGIKRAGTDSKVLLEGRVYRLDSLIHRGYGLRLTEIGEQTLVFTDHAGKQYFKSL